MTTQRFIIESIEPSAFAVRLRESPDDPVHEIELRGKGPWDLGINGGATVRAVAPADTAITLRLDNSDGSGTVRAAAFGKGAIAWTQSQGTLLGAKWGRDRKGAPIVMLEDSPGLVGEIQRVLPQITLDLTRYTTANGASITTTRAVTPSHDVTLIVDNMGGSGIVQITAIGPQAHAWTAAKGTLLGIKWSGGADGVPKIILEDRAELVREVEHEAPDVKVDTSAYELVAGEPEAAPPSEATVPRLPPRRSHKRGGGGRRSAAKESGEELPSDDEITLVLDNLDRTDGQVLITAKGPRAAAWAEHQGTLLGSRWEVADGDLPYVYVDDAVDLVDQIQREHKGIWIDQAEFWKHSAEELAEIGAALARAGERTAASRAQPAPAADELQWAGISEDGVVGLMASVPGGAYKILRAGGRTYGLFFEYDAGGYQKIACGALDVLKARAKELFAEAGPSLNEELAALVCRDDDDAGEVPAAVQSAAPEPAPPTPPAPAAPAAPPAPAAPAAPTDARVPLKRAGLRPLSAASKAILDHLTCDLEDPSGDGTSNRVLDNAPGAYQPAHIERIGANRYSVAHYFQESGDQVADPDIEFILEAGEWYPAAATLAYGRYREAIRWEEGRLFVSKKEYSGLRDLATTLLNNIKHQQGVDLKKPWPRESDKASEGPPASASPTEARAPAAEPAPAPPINPDLDDKLIQSFAKALQNVKIER